MKAIVCSPDDDDALAVNEAFSKGQFDDVVVLARIMCIRRPDSGFGWRALGTALVRNGTTGQAVEALDRALATDQTDRQAWNVRGVALHGLGNSAAAIDSYAKGIVADPSDPGLYFNQGATFGAIGFLDVAIRAYARCVALDRSSHAGWINLGNTLRTAARVEESLHAYSRAISRDPSSVDSLGNFGVALQECGRCADASIAYLRALRVNPMSAEQFCNLGVCMSASGEHEGANFYFRHALALRPDHHKSMNNLSVSLRTVHAYKDSLCQADRSLTVSPANPDSLNNRGTIFRNLQRYTQALGNYDAALAARPDFPEAMTNRGTALMELRRVDEAIQVFKRAYLLEDRNSSALWNAALALLSIGDFEGGWLLHENRFVAGAVADPKIDPTRIFNPVKRGQAPVLVRAEQGLGDELMFGSMISDFHLFAGSLVVQSDRRLLPLFRRSFDSEIRFIETGSQIDLEAFGAEISAGSIGKYVRMQNDSFSKASGGYLKSDHDEAKYLRKLIGAAAGSPVLGISWRTTNPDSAGQRDIDLALICEVLRETVPHARLVSLQYGKVSAEIERVEKSSGVAVLQCPSVDVTQDIDRVAALITACDAVVTIGNTTAHLCGALGKKAAVLLPFAPSWRWMADGRNTPWYSSIELFRKKNPDTSWRDVVVEAALSLRDSAW
jgi:tetratricopeptide (TPR) repeat protein